VFDCSVGGDASAPLVLMLHGFCVSRYFWDKQIPVLAAAGYFAVAPNQRGYAASARPDPTNFDDYRSERGKDEIMSRRRGSIRRSLGPLRPAPIAHTKRTVIRLTRDAGRYHW
jgi:pimeloyl-ACP methyl ester carboxylesterase